jgi:Putative beta-barrel porin-2, OmpL-like. bbp2
LFQVIDAEPRRRSGLSAGGDVSGAIFNLLPARSRQNDRERPDHEGIIIMSRTAGLTGSAALASVAWLALAGPAAADDQAAAAPPAPAPVAPAPAAPAAPAPTPMPYPSMSASLSANPNPATFDAGPLGKLTVDGVLTGGGLWQSNPAVDYLGRNNHDGYGDIFNGTVIINKTSGFFQLYAQVGLYSLPALGTPYVRSDKVDQATYGFFQQGFIKLVPNSNFSVEIGALPTLIGDEYTFTFENMNIERGLLWNQENAVTKGIQVNYTKGQWTVSASWNDGFYSDRYTSASALVTYTFKNSDTLTGVAMGSFSKIHVNTFVSPASLANSQIYNLIYTHTHGPWVISPYIQYTHVPNVAGWTPSGSTIGGAVLAKYNFTPQFNLAGRVEYISSSGQANLMYGPGSDAFSLTFTPTYQKGIFFIRGEVSYVDVTSGTPGSIFGRDGTAKSQVRGLIETGVLY